MAPELNKLRQEIDYNFEEWSGILTNRSFKKIFPDGLEQEEILSRPQRDMTTKILPLSSSS